MLDVNRTQELHAPADLPVNGAGIEHVNTLATLTVREAVAEVVHIAIGLSLLSFNESCELLKEIGAMGCFVTGEDLKDASGGIRQKEETVMVLGVGDP